MNLVKIITLLVVTSSVTGMQRPHAMGLPRTIKENCLVRTCAKCCTAECCLVATVVCATEVFLCGCLVNPESSERCDPSAEKRMLKVGMGIAFLAVAGGTTYIAKSSKRN